MKITEHISSAAKEGKTLISFEVLPPLKGTTIDTLFDQLHPLMEFKPSWVNVTYHRSETVFRKKQDGSMERVEVKKRPGTVGICAALKNKYGVDAVPHMICGGFTKHETEDALIDLHFLGIDNILVLRGDAAKNEPAFIPEVGGHHFATELLEQVINMNHGIYLDEDIKNGGHTNFCAGVAGYPEKHFEAFDLESDMQKLVDKVNKGAEFIMTQMFFDNDKFFTFEKKCREMGITIPIIPGLKPLTKKTQLEILPKIFYVNIPEALREAMLSCKNDKECEKVGTDWLLWQSKELMNHGVPVLHYYTVRASKVVSNVFEKLL